MYNITEHSRSTTGLTGAHVGLSLDDLTTLAHAEYQFGTRNKTRVVITAARLACKHVGQVRVKSKAQLSDPVVACK